MKLYVRNKFFSIGGSSTVKDENGNDVMTVKGKVFSIRHKKRVMNMDGEVLYRIRNRFFNFINHRAYITDANGTDVATVTRKGLKLRQEYVVEGCEDEISVSGDFLSWSLSIVRNGDEIGTIRRRFDLTDSFEVEVDDSDDGAFIVALIIAIDNIVDNITNSGRT